ncbi:hypothetical protein LINPERPRIM_LOCUS32110, partial [Linum perenne]
GAFCDAAARRILDEDIDLRERAASEAKILHPAYLRQLQSSIVASLVQHSSSKSFHSNVLAQVVAGARCQNPNDLLHRLRYEELGILHPERRIPVSRAVYDFSNSRVVQRHSV